MSVDSSNVAMAVIRFLIADSDRKHRRFAEPSSALPSAA